MCKSIHLHSLSVLLIVLVTGLLFAQKSPAISQSEPVIDGGNQNGSSNQTESGTTEESDETTDANVEDDQSTEEVKQNRLASESSPYLLQHARNPVDWYPWGQEAFEKAKRENKLVFLSVGYAACHWCHVMERESFEDDEIAKVLNERFVCVKVDREERPDVDQIYMTAVQLVSGHGGWPMSVFVLPDGKPFWGGTYFPARDGDRGNSTGFLTILSQIDLAWKEQTEQVRAQSIAVTKAIQSQQLSSAGDFAGRSYDDAMVAQTLMALRKQYDATYGGFSAGDGGPKFPEPSNLHFLASVAASEQTKNIKPSQVDQQNNAQSDNGEVDDLSLKESLQDQGSPTAAEMLVTTLNGMIRGGMYDHIGGGFHRYSVDPQWQIPHFEKMLYDNAQLARVYASAAVATGNQEYRSIAEGICDFMIRELRDPAGGFYSSIDADSEGEEGKFYRWDRDELKTFQSLGSFADFANIYRLDKEPNFESEFYVPAPRLNLSEVANERGETYRSMMGKLEPVARAMFEQRAKRLRPITDNKILTSWNGLTISALADAGRLLERKDYLRASVECLEFIMSNSRSAEGRLLRSYARGEAKLGGYLDDYAFLISGILALHRSTSDDRLLRMASGLMNEQIKWFWDEKDGGFFFTASDHPESIVRLKNPVDGAIPSGISVTAENLSYVLRAPSEVLDSERRESYRARLASTVQSVMPLVSRAPAAATRMGAVASEMSKAAVPNGS